MENHGENRAPNICILSCVFITGYKIAGYVANLSDTRKFTFVRQKSTLRPDGIGDGLYVKD